MKLFKHSTPLLALLVLAAAGCKDDDAAPVNTPPEITITSPTDAQLETGFTRGQTVMMVGSVEDDKEIATISIDVFYGTLDLDLDETIEVNDQTYTLNYSVEIPDQAPSGDYSVRITAVDNEGAPSTVEKEFAVN